MENREKVTELVSGAYMYRRLKKTVLLGNGISLNMEGALDWMCGRKQYKIILK